MRPPVRRHRLHRRLAVDDTVAAVKELLPNGVDHVFECVGHPALIRQAIDLLDWGGNCVLLGVPKLGTEASFVVNTLYNDKSIMGCRYGTTRPHHDIPLLVELLPRRPPQARRDGQPGLRPRRHPARRSTTCTHGKLNRGVLAVSTP